MEGDCLISIIRIEIEKTMRLLPLIIAVALALPCRSLATLVITSIENKYQYEPGFGYHQNDYKITWAQVPGPKDNELIGDGINMYGAMEEHDHSVFACDSRGSGMFPGVPGTTCVMVHKGMTWGQAEELWMSTYGARGPGVVGHSSRLPGSRECVMFAGQFGTGAAIGGQKNNGELVCVGAPTTPDPLCYVDSSPVLEFVTSPDRIADYAETSAQLICGHPASVVLMSGTGVSTITFPWGRADVTVNGRPLPAHLAPAPIANITVGASISGARAEPGLYTGSLVLVVGYE